MPKHRFQPTITLTELARRNHESRAEADRQQTETTTQQGGQQDPPTPNQQP